MKKQTVCTLVAFMACTLACGLTFTSTTLFAQVARVPVGPPVHVGSTAPSGPQHFALPRGPLPLLSPQAAKNGGVQLGQSYDGIDFQGSNCFCLPPDTNVAVGNNFVVETVNTQIRVFDKTTGLVLLDEPLSTFFGATSGGDVFVVYDDNADRWYVSAFDSTDTGLFLAVSLDGNPLDGFPHVYDLTDGIGGFPDYQKIGFNKDTIFITYNNFGTSSGPFFASATVVAIDKAAALTGTPLSLSSNYFVSQPKFQFRAMPPAQMHGDVKGGVEWFVSTDGTDSGGNTIRVTKMTNYLSNTPQFTYTSLRVTPFRFALTADQPGGIVTTFPNTTTYQLHYHLGRLVTAMASSTASDGFVYPKGLFYQIDVNGNGAVKPRLIKQGVIDPGPGVAVQMPSVAEDQQGNLGFTWMESSSTEYLSMWIGNLYTNGNFSAQVAAPGGGFFYFNFRIGDYSATVLDQSDGKTFWAANEYIGSNGGPDPSTSDIWLTHITSFTGR
jgi:hypothetical protein